MTVITVVAIAAIAAIFYAFVWPKVKESIANNVENTTGGNTAAATQADCTRIGGTWDAKTNSCDL